MKVKTVDIARKLGISKATVSLALNGKPGVSEKTREQILKCRDEMEEQLNKLFANSPQKTDTSVQTNTQISSSAQTSRIIKIIMFDRGLGIICDPVLNIQTDVLRIFDTEAQRMKYSTSITYAGTDEMEIQRVIEGCNDPLVAGVILFATELTDTDNIQRFQKIKKPLVIYDHGFNSSCHSVIISNETAAQEAVEFLTERGCRTITYLAQAIDMYNFECRRRGFAHGIEKAGLNAEHCPIIPAGTTIESVSTYMRSYLAEHSLPDAFLTENYQISIGVMAALKERNIEIPEQVSVFGIDEPPSYMTNGIKLSCMRVPHAERAYHVMELLFREMQSPYSSKLQISVHCERIQGATVR